ncbi:MAG TPA: zf-HC2 domain-containing protein [Bryobacteraceae bacterium]
MDHTSAIDAQAAERYLLGDLSAREAEEFERHYFECPECALDVATGEIFAANARALFAQQARRTVGGRWRARSPKRLWKSFEQGWTQTAMALPTAAAVLFGAIILYQGTVVIPGVRRSVEVARALPAFELMGSSRGERSRVAVAAGTPSFALSADIPPDVHFAQYRCVLTLHRRSVFSLTTPAPAEGRPITILVPARKLRPGAYQLGIAGLGPDGRADKNILTYSFDFQIN